jgi:hypothetical protein
MGVCARCAVLRVVCWPCAGVQLYASQMPYNRRVCLVGLGRPCNSGQLGCRNFGYGLFGYRLALPELPKIISGFTS